MSSKAMLLSVAVSLKATGKKREIGYRSNSASEATHLRVGINVHPGILYMQ